MVSGLAVRSTIQLPFLRFLTFSSRITAPPPQEIIVWLQFCKLRIALLSQSLKYSSPYFSNISRMGIFWSSTIMASTSTSFMASISLKYSETVLFPVPINPIKAMLWSNSLLLCTHLISSSICLKILNNSSQ